MPDSPLLDLDPDRIATEKRRAREKEEADPIPDALAVHGP
jgi:hypothetical protein